VSSFIKAATPKAREAGESPTAAGTGGDRRPHGEGQSGKAPARNRVNAFCAYSNSHHALFRQLMVSAHAEPRLQLWPDPLPSDTDNGDYGTPVYGKILRDIYRLWRDRIAHHTGSTIMFTGADVVILAPFVETAAELMHGHDFAYQRELKDESLINPDVMFVHCSGRSLRAWDRWLESMPRWDGHLPHQNDLMRAAMDGFASWRFLPETFAATMNGGLNRNAVLFHANWTPPPNSVAQKMELLQNALKIMVD
jgi:hypothetical protein